MSTRGTKHTRSADETASANDASSAKKPKNDAATSASAVAAAATAPRANAGGAAVAAAAAAAASASATDVKMSYSPASFQSPKAMPVRLAPPPASASASVSDAAAAANGGGGGGAGSAVSNARVCAWPKLISAQPNYWRNAKFDMKDPKNPKTNTFCLVPGEFKNEHQNNRKQTTVRLSPNPDFMADWGGRRGKIEAAKLKAKAAASKAGGGAMASDKGKSEDDYGPIEAEILCPPMVPLYMTMSPYGSLAETNPGRKSTTSFPFYSISSDKVKENSVRVAFDGWAPHEDMVDEKDPSHREREFVAFKTFMIENVRDWMTAYIFKSPEIKCKFRDGLKNTFPDGIPDVERLRHNAFRRAATSDMMPNVKVLDEKRDAAEAMGAKIEGDCILNTERLHLKHKLLYEAKNKDRTAKKPHELDLAAMALSDYPIEAALMQRGFGVKHTPLYSAGSKMEKDAATGRVKKVLAFPLIPKDKRPFQTCGYAQDGTPVPLSAEQYRAYSHYFTVPTMSINANLDGGTSGTSSVAWRRDLVGLIVLESSIPRQRPRPEAAPALQTVDLSKNKEAREAEQELLESLGGETVVAGVCGVAVGAGEVGLLPDYSNEAE